MTHRPLPRTARRPTPAKIRTRRNLAAASLLAILSLFGLADLTAAQPATLDATALVRRAVEHRLDDAKHHSPLMYQLRRIDERRDTTDGRRDTTKEIIETPDGGVARLIAINGRPLSPAADRAELDRLDTLAQHPELQERRRRSEQKDAARITHLLSLLPDALLYKLEGRVPCGAGECARLSFVPNPHFAPPDLEASVLCGIAGELWIDQAEQRMVRLDAHFITDVDVGFGILGRLNKGGSLLLEQSEINSNDWELTRLKIHVTGKLLMVKSVRYQVDEQASRFSRVASGVRYRDAIQQLRKLDLSPAL